MIQGRHWHTLLMRLMILSLMRYSNLFGCLINARSKFSIFLIHFCLQIMQTVSQSVRPLVSKGNQCYIAMARFVFSAAAFLFTCLLIQFSLRKIIFLYSVSEIFPTVSLNFAGGASMVLRPEDYLLQQNSVVSQHFIS